jgi:hypothetical protein
MIPNATERHSPDCVAVKRGLDAQTVLKRGPQVSAIERQQHVSRRLQVALSKVKPRPGQFVAF